MNMKKWTTLITIALITVSCKKTAIPAEASQTKFSNVLILGNSITYTPANPAGGWPGNWGMAASAAEFDFVHLLAAHFKDKNLACNVTAKNVAAFEREFLTYDFDAELKPLRDTKPDLIIVRIGENVQQDFDKVAFEKRYSELLAYLIMNNSNAKIVAAGSFWGNDAVDKIMSKYSPFVALSPLGHDMSNYAWGLFADHGIQSHPGDKGMKAISDMIWAKVGSLK